VVITKQYNISEMAETKKTLERENLKLLNEVNSLQSLERIENIAEKKLEMNRPDLESSLLVESYNNKTFTENNSI
jgi:cell division protein FtsL